MGALTRRAMFASGATLAIAGTAAAAPPAAAGPDAELLKLCAAFDALERAYQATPFDCAPCSPEDQASDAERERIIRVQMPLVDRMTELRATTRAGQIARARSLVLWKPEMLEDGPGDFGECLASAIVRDLVAPAGASA